MERRILTVNTAASSFALTTKEAVKSDLGITVSTYDALIDSYILASSKELATACRRVFGSELVTELFRFDETKEFIVLKRYPVSSVVSVTEDTDPALTAADYELDKESGIIYRLDADEPISWSCRKLVIQYTGGWVLPAGAPEDLAKAAKAMVKAQYLSKGRDPLVRSESVPGVYDVAYWVGNLPGGAEWPQEIMHAVSAYRAIAVEAGA